MPDRSWHEPTPQPDELNHAYIIRLERSDTAYERLGAIRELMAESILAVTDAEFNPLPYPLDEYAPLWLHELHRVADLVRELDDA